METHNTLLIVHFHYSLSLSCGVLLALYFVTQYPCGHDALPNATTNTVETEFPSLNLKAYF